MGERVSRLFPRFAGLDSRESGNDGGIFLVRQCLRVLPENSYPLSAKALGFDSAQASTPLSPLTLDVFSVGLRLFDFDGSGGRFHGVIHCQGLAILLVKAIAPFKEGGVIWVVG